MIILQLTHFTRSKKVPRAVLLWTGEKMEYKEAVTVQVYLGVAEGRMS